MKRIPLLLSLLLVVVSRVVSQEGGIGPGPKPASEPALWERYTVKGEEFSVTLPTVPAMTSKALRNADQKPRTQRHLKTSFDGVVYSIDVFENPKPMRSLEDFIAEQKL